MASTAPSQIAAQLSRTSSTEWISALALLALAYPTSAITYNLYFNPLKHYPGPREHAPPPSPGVSPSSGGLPADIHSLHDIYGPVVCIRPSELAFADAPAWQDIYDHKVAGRGARLATGVKELPKYLLFYNAHPRQPSSLVTAIQKDHSRWRRITAPGFSDKSLKAQEPLVMRYVGLLMTRLKERTGEVVDLMVWYNWTTFDIIGDLAFGDSFGCLEEARYHPFIDLVCKRLRQSSRLVPVTYMGLQRLAYFWPPFLSRPR